MTGRRPLPLVGEAGLFDQLARRYFLPADRQNPLLLLNQLGDAEVIGFFKLAHVLRKDRRQKDRPRRSGTEELSFRGGSLLRPPQEKTAHGTS
ncbi:hypothetical protein ASH00_11765 [Arthrobacter sp. Soil782]|nr:hypothetical protein ASH00_11765 [Arthrobacter sp. Soil782]